ncbi:DUF421 domain-containing protein [Halalkalibacter nanhaiisediminis]|uniref:Uncharacterized membrane protein YcaP (DUF421 family) n=1 Tax=Halalkalibacter nanhaiisediminis TaxID=688079 RepID=A0A562QD34_9BACI|nr:DUF421 domain-containing protein [Halalkalibacter nanhaiisediminis]TWI54644.1 uncharacterized membrane protein YcaP (DUF421 family) [Halalkalibacter nanhaiisediminis]
MVLNEMAIVLGRILTIFPLLLATALIMGKRSIGELPIFDFLVIITLASVTGADIADPNINHIHTAFAIIAIGLFQKFVALLLINKRKIGKWITFEPTVVVKDGQMLVKNIKAIRYSIDNILQMLRQKDIFDIAEVQLAIIESNGDISVQKKPEKSTPLIEDLGITKKSSGISYPVIIEGVIREEVLKDLRLTKEALRKRLQDEGIIRIDSIFLCTINDEGDLHLAYSRNDERIERIQH